MPSRRIHVDPQAKCLGSIILQSVKKKSMCISSGQPKSVPGVRLPPAWPQKRPVGMWGGRWPVSGLSCVHGLCLWVSRAPGLARKAWASESNEGPERRRPPRSLRSRVFSAAGETERGQKTPHGHRPHTRVLPAPPAPASRTWPRGGGS